MKKVSILKEGQIKKQVKGIQQSDIINQLAIDETKAMEKIFNGSCCHSGIHAYQKKSN